jgi:hypothetical protein
MRVSIGRLGRTLLQNSNAITFVDNSASLGEIFGSDYRRQEWLDFSQGQGTSLFQLSADSINVTWNWSSLMPVPNALPVASDNASEHSSKTSGARCRDNSVDGGAAQMQREIGGRHVVPRKQEVVSASEEIHAPKITTW